eukprot:2804331-Lingulodinium_polyedra.AAC.1
MNCPVHGVPAHGVLTVGLSTPMTWSPTMSTPYAGVLDDVGNWWTNRDDVARAQDLLFVDGD